MTVSFASLQPTVRLADQVAQRLEAEIVAAHLLPGAKLPTEAQLVEQFGVSRTVIREAVSQLKSRGLVEARQGSGVFVQSSGFVPLRFDPARSASREAVIQIVEVRRALEAEVAELASQRRTPVHLDAIRAAVHQLDQAVAAGRDGVEEDVQFHRQIAQAAGNPFLISTLDYLAQFLRGATRVTRANEARRIDFTQAVNVEHQRIVEAIEAGDATAARTAASTHMNNAITRIRQAGPDFWTQDGERLARPLIQKRKI